MAPNIVGINHQHFFCFRLDFNVDGVKNNVYELNVRPMGESRGHLQQNTFSLERTLLRKEEEAARDLNEKQSRCWKVVNPNSRNYLGHLPGYVLHPHTNAYPLSHPDSYNRKRAGFLAHHFWTTRFNPEELYAAGEYPVSSTGGEGRPKWVSADSIDKLISCSGTPSESHIRRGLRTGRSCPLRLWDSRFSRRTALPEIQPWMYRKRRLH